MEVAFWLGARLDDCSNFGHSSIAMSNGYVDPSEDAVFTAMRRLGGAQKWIHDRNCKSRAQYEEAVTILKLKEKKWSGRMDLNHRPPGPE